MMTTSTMKKLSRVRKKVQEEEEEDPLDAFMADLEKSDSKKKGDTSTGINGSEEEGSQRRSRRHRQGG